MELALREEAQHDLWTCWGHALTLQLVSKDTIRVMIRVLIDEYWLSYARGDMHTMDGMTRMLRIFAKVNELITHRLMTEPKLSCRLFTPHLIDKYHRIWSVPGRLIGLPPNNYGD